jgi:hypothetical protein
MYSGIHLHFAMHFNEEQLIALLCINITVYVKYCVHGFATSVPYVEEFDIPH